MSGRILLALLAGWLALPATAGSVTGMASYRERIALPPNARLEVRVEDVSLADAPAAVIGQSTVSPAGQVPIPFSVVYDEARVVAGHRYALRATILVEDELWFATSTSFPVLTRGAPSTVGTVVLSRVTTPPARTLTGTYWKLTTIGAQPALVADGLPEPHLILHPDGLRLSGSGGCNNLAGGYVLEDKHLHFGQVAATMRACLLGMEQEGLYLKALEATASYRISGDQLSLLDTPGNTLATFRAVDLR